MMFRTAVSSGETPGVAMMVATVIWREPADSWEPPDRAWAKIIAKHLISEDIFGTQLNLSRRFIAIGIRRENGAKIPRGAELVAIRRRTRGLVKRMIRDVEVRMVQ